MHYVYLICREQDFQWYIGCTSDLRVRIREHNGNETKLEMKYDLIYYEAYLHRLDAIRRECFLKSAAGRDFLKRHLMWFLRMKQPGLFGSVATEPTRMTSEAVVPAHS